MVLHLSFDMYKCRTFVHHVIAQLIVAVILITILGLLVWFYHQCSILILRRDAMIDPSVVIRMFFCSCLFSILC